MVIYYSINPYLCTFILIFVAIKKEVKTGLIVTAALGMLIFGLNYLKGINLFSHTKTIYSIYPNVEGLMVSNAVQVNGFHVGQIKSVEIEPNASGLIIVGMLITNTDIKIPKGSIAKIFSSDLLGSRAIEIILGTSSEYIKDKDTLPSSAEISLKETVDQQVLPLKNKIERLISSIDTTINTIDAIFNSTTRDNLTQSIASIRVSLKHIENTSITVDELMGNEKGHISSILAKLDELVGTFAKNGKQINKIIDNFANISDTIAKANIQKTINNADTALYYTSQIMQKINKGQGTLGLLVKDTTLYMRLSSSTEQLNLLLKDLREHPKRYVHFSVFGKKDQ
jgi:phospholipid/cholesterol/gamma-HCH transport system substrate-binding protein